MSGKRIIIIGAGIGGLAAALRLSHAGHEVTVLESLGAPGGKMRTLPTEAGPVDAGPTVLTLRAVFDDLFRDVGESLADHLTLKPLDTLARHYWSDGTRLDLRTDMDANSDEIETVFGARARQDFERFTARAKRLFEAFDAPIMQAAVPSQSALVGQVLRHPRILQDMAPTRSLAGLLRRSFRNPRLAQLFGRYATYVGGTPFLSPAILSLIWHAEAQGVWVVEGGMHRLAQAIHDLAAQKGAQFHFNTPARRIVQQGGRVSGVETQAGLLPADMVLFNGDPRALRTGLLGKGVSDAVPDHAVAPRSLSAEVLAFAAAPKGVELAHHTVFFADEERAEFDPLARGASPQDATLYLCAQDHGTVAPDALQRFEVIRNAPPLSGAPNAQDEGKPQCQTRILERFADFGLFFDRVPPADCLTLPSGFDHLFPASLGSLYGRSPHGLTAAFKRPTARTSVTGLYLCGGGAHPGAGVPMAALSGRHAAEAMTQDLSSISTSPRTVTPGGISTASPRTDAGPSLS